MKRGDRVIIIQKKHLIYLGAFLIFLALIVNVKSAVVGHPASEITAGIFGAAVGGGDFSFPGSVNITNGLTVKGFDFSADNFSVNQMNVKNFTFDGVPVSFRRGYQDLGSESAGDWSVAGFALWMNPANTGYYYCDVGNAGVVDGNLHCWIQFGQNTCDYTSTAQNCPPGHMIINSEDNCDRAYSAKSHCSPTNNVPIYTCNDVTYTQTYQAGPLYWHRTLTCNYSRTGPVEMY